MRRDSWPACERLGMCCVEEGPSPLNHMPLKTPPPPPPPPTPIPPTAHSSTLVLSVNAAGVPSTPPFAALPTTTSPLTNTPDNWHQLRGWTQCGAGAAQLASLPTWHRLDLWHVTHPPRKPLSPPHRCSLSLSPLHTCMAPGHGTRPAATTSSSRLGQFNSNWG